MSTYKLIWSDEFDYVGKPDPNKWSHDIGGHGWGNEEPQLYTTNERNSFVQDGKLTITALKEKVGENDYTSAKLHTYGKFSFQYGRIAVKAKLPKGKGSWPAIWLLSDRFKVDKPWPLSGELDVMEHVGRDPHNIFVTIHSKEFNHRLNNQRLEIVHVENCFDDFIEYTMDWKKDSIEFFIDGKSFAKFERRDIEEDQSELGWPYDQPYFILLNLAVGGTFGGEIDNEIFPLKYEIEYVRVYEIEED